MSTRSFLKQYWIKHCQTEYACNILRALNCQLVHSLFTSQLRHYISLKALESHWCLAGGGGVHDCLGGEEKPENLLTDLPSGGLRALLRITLELKACTLNHRWHHHKLWSRAFPLPLADAHASKLHTAMVAPFRIVLSQTQIKLSLT
jgi:hypothetical protein